LFLKSHIEIPVIQDESSSETVTVEVEQAYKGAYHHKNLSQEEGSKKASKPSTNNRV
jgi:hypothetical protein